MAHYDLTGMRFGSWVVLALKHKDNWKPHWTCRCDCGVVAIIPTSNLRSGASTRCTACLAKHNQRHGHCANRRGYTRTYKIWASMLARCSEAVSGTKVGLRYYDRGIRVCSRWLDFVNFLHDMGEAPPKCSIDRADTNGHYCPENCRWASVAEQNRNTTRNVNLTLDGRTQCLADWATELGMRATTIHGRLSRGWSVERALTEPVHAECRHR